MAITDSSSPLPLATLLTDYSRWLEFVITAQRTIRQYDGQLARISKQFTDLSHLSDYLRTCMHQRACFLGSLTIQLTGKVAQLRAEPANSDLHRQLTRAHPIMAGLIAEITDAMADISTSYQTLFTVRQNPPTFIRLTPAFQARHHQA